MFSWGKQKQQHCSKIPHWIVFWKSNSKQLPQSSLQHISWQFVVFGHIDMIIQLGGLGWNFSYCYPNKTLLFQKSEDCTNCSLRAWMKSTLGTWAFFWVLSTVFFSQRGHRSISNRAPVVNNPTSTCSTPQPSLISLPLVSLPRCFKMITT